MNSISKTKQILLLSVTAIAVLGVCHPNNANAQTNLPGPADPSRVNERFDNEKIVPNRASGVTTPSSSIAVEAPDGAEDVMFVLNSITIEGADAYDSDEVSGLYQNFIGQEVSLYKIYEIAKMLTLKYREDGYILSQVVVPPQTIRGGDIKLRVVEGFVNNLSVEPSPTLPLLEEKNERAYRLVRAYLEKATKKRPLNIKELERGLLLVDDLPGITARAVMSQAQDAVGGANLSLLLSHDPYSGLVSVDNYGSRFLGPLQTTGLVAANSYFGLGEKIELVGVYAPDNFDWVDENLAFGSLRYTMPLSDNGLSLDMSFSHTRTDPGFTLEEFGVEGEATSFKAGLSYPIVRSRGLNLFGISRIEATSIESTSNIDIDREDDVRMGRLGVEFDWQDNILNGAFTSGDVLVSRGFNILGGGEKGDIDLIRPDSNPEATKISASLRRLQNINRSFRLSGTLFGQYASNGLVSSEEFGVGGAATIGRGYDPSEITGDHGISGSLELQWSLYNPGDTTTTPSLQPYAFYDVGRVWNEDPANAQEERSSIASTGLGLRLGFQQGINADFMVAQPLTRNVATNNDTDRRFFFKLQKSF